MRTEKKISGLISCHYFSTSHLINIYYISIISTEPEELAIFFLISQFYVCGGDVSGFFFFFFKLITFLSTFTNILAYLGIEIEL